LHLREEALTRVQEDCSPGRFQEDLRTILGLRKPHVWTAAVDSTLRDPDPAAIRLDS
jgi:hypothetical protein